MITPSNQETPVFSPDDLLMTAQEAENLAQEAPDASQKAPDVAQKVSEPLGGQGDTPKTSDALPEAPRPQETTKQEPEADPRITEDDRNAFMRHILGGNRFIKEYSYHGGAAVIRLQSRTVAENDMVYDLMAADIRAGVISSTATSVDYLLRIYRYYLASSLIAMEVKSDVGKTVFRPEGDSIEARHKWINESFNETQLRLLLRCQEEFEYLVSTLFKESISEDFTGGRVGVF